MNGLVRELSRELAQSALDYVANTVYAEIAARYGNGADTTKYPRELSRLSRDELAEVLFDRAAAWLDGQDMQGLMLKVLAHRL